MRFRPCIDIHNGKVKQIVGGSLRDEGDQAKENFVSTQDAAFFAEMYQKDRISGGHVILLNAKDSPFYEKTKEQARHFGRIQEDCRSEAALPMRMRKIFWKPELLM